MSSNICRLCAVVFVVGAMAIGLGALPVLADPYEGTLRVYIVEPDSRWNDRNGFPYRYGFLDWAIVTDVTVDSDPVVETASWDASANGFNGVTSDNIMVIAVLFNAAGETIDAVPPSGRFFTAHQVDAAAAALPGTSGSNSTGDGYTHTVFLEEGSVTT